MRIHPIELESYEIMRARIDLSRLSEGPRAVVERIIHATADLDFATTVHVDEAACAAGVAALEAGATVVSDVEMVRAGLSGLDARCYLREAHPVDGETRSAAAMSLAARLHPEGTVVVVGCAPTALVRAVELIDADVFRPALLVGLPVGFVGAAESKALAHACPVPSITNTGEKGGSAVAAAAVNALNRLTRPAPERR